MLTFLYSRSSIKHGKQKQKLTHLYGTGSRYRSHYESGQSQPKDGKRYIIIFNERFYRLRLLFLVNLHYNRYIVSAFFNSLKQILRKRRVVTCGASLLLCVVFLALSNPSRVSLALLLVPFVLFGLFVHELLYLLLVDVGGRRTFAYRRIVPGSGAFLVVVALLLQSLNQLGFKDILIISVLVIVFWLYLWRADFLNK